MLTGWKPFSGVVTNEKHAGFHRRRGSETSVAGQVVAPARCTRSKKLRVEGLIVCRTKH